MNRFPQKKVLVNHNSFEKRLIESILQLSTPESLPLYTIDHGHVRILEPLQLPTEPHPIVHRIVAVDDGGVGYLTKGDNNARDDEWVYAAAGLGRLRREHIVGRQDHSKSI